MSPGGIRERLRAELTAEIITTARRHLAERGVAELSLRGVAREVGIAPSAVYRYFPDRDALLTELIVQAYTRLGEAAQQAEAGVAREDHLGRWIAVFHAVRHWALDHPHEYSLIYGSPVPGYQAPQDTVRPASRVALLLAVIAFDASRGPGLAELPVPDLPADLHADAGERLKQVIHAISDSGSGPGGEWNSDTDSGTEEQAPEGVSAQGLTALAEISPEAVIAVVDAWTTLFGAVSFELFGHYHRVVEARKAHMDHLARSCARAAGIPAA